MSGSALLKGVRLTRGGRLRPPGTLFALTGENVFGAGRAHAGLTPGGSFVLRAPNYCSTSGAPNAIFPQMTDERLGFRTALPDDLHGLVADFPREQWAGSVGPYAAFYLQRHEMFRRLSDRMREDAEKLLDGALAPERHAVALSRFGGHFLSDLHAHHQIEDAHFFPKLAPLDRGVARAFDLLEADHEAIDGALKSFADRANAVLRAGDEWRDAAGAHLDGLAGLRALLDRHLEDEEDIVVPLMLKYGEEGLV